MLRKVKPRSNKGRGGHFGIIASDYNARYVDAMLNAASGELGKAGAKTSIVRVPGAFEIPLAAMKMARRRGISGVICLGVILRGETVHAEHIGREVSRALMDIQLESGIPVIHEVLLLENEAQARARCLEGRFSRGREAAQTALAMAGVLREI